MNYKLNGAVAAIAVSLAMLFSGCTGQDISHMEATDISSQTTAAVPKLTTTVTTTTKARTTTLGKMTSGTTCTTLPTDSYTVESLLASMSLQDKIYQLFIVTPEALTQYSGAATEAGSLTKSAIEAAPVGGIIYFSQNIEGWHQTYEMISKSQEYSQTAHNDIGMFFAVDEEGGSVARVSEKLGVYKSHDMEYYGNNEDYDEVYNLGNTIGANLYELGFNLNLAPVADVEINPNNELGSRIFSDDPQIVADMVSQYVKGVEDAGVSATLKHFPGLGAGEGNTHDGSVVIDRTISELAENEFLAFKGGILADADFVMVGHQITTASGDNLPGCLSPVVVTDWLKYNLGFTGIVITDSHSMGAITDNYTPGDAAVKAVQAGVDMILMPYDLNNAVQGIKSAVSSGEITEERINESVRKILTKKYSMGIIDVEVSTTSTSD